MIPKDDPVLALAEAWFRKLDNPNNATYRLAHARHDPDAGSRKPFDPDAVLAAYGRTSGKRMKRLATAVKLMK